MASSTPVDRLQPFFGAQHRVDIEQPEPRHRRRAPLHAQRIGDRPPEHLITAAEAEDSPALAAMGEDVDVPALAAQEFEIRERRLRARQDHQRRIARQRPAGPDHDQLDPRLGAQRVEIVEIGDARQYRHRDAERIPALARFAALGTLSRMRERGDPARRGRVGEGRAPSKSSAGSSEAAGKNGTVPNERSPVRAPSAAIPPSNSRISPRNLLTM